MWRGVAGLFWKGWGMGVGALTTPILQLINPLFPVCSPLSTYSSPYFFQPTTVSRHGTPQPVAPSEKGGGGGIGGSGGGGGENRRPGPPAPCVRRHGDLPRGEGAGEGDMGGAFVVAIPTPAPKNALAPLPPPPAHIPRAAPTTALTLHPPALAPVAAPVPAPSLSVGAHSWANSSFPQIFTGSEMACPRTKPHALHPGSAAAATPRRGRGCWGCPRGPGGDCGFG